MRRATPHDLCLGIETSCDETSLALVSDGKLLAHVLASQSDLHALFGGVVPELASREHYRYIGRLFDELLERASVSPKDIAAVAVSRGPGLLGSLLVGVAFAKALALGLSIPLVGVNHLHAHLLAAGLEQEISYPALGLLISGGHTNIYRISSPSSFRALGRTLDDALGEAFDKIGNLLGMSYPSGRLVDEAARLGNASVSFPLPYVRNTNLDFSFSGLKTAVATYIEKNCSGLSVQKPVTDVRLLPGEILDLCASFTHTVAETLAVKLQRAFRQENDIRFCLLAGGVAANTTIRGRIRALAAENGAGIAMPSPALCTDNAAMVAYAGWLLRQEGLFHPLDMETIPRGRAIPDDYERDPIFSGDTMSKASCLCR
ncbi:MAG: tRNA (adenosine(37)-N6)-threonylcarbamoyltransferase complex transferase subunit TsaD [Desulfovibrio sp.]|nr:tRNA (adenosine(37)-N6)-threonylcarbamoyltransferase complex transferase subunit TsaD [Desulfovibrio sp.]